ncbi:uncharacterized protein LOC130825436 isoform X2 [Amaranthus tricolor]|nr:uncharacterized protein LOC130825436 isoform X2 [Amaranthus tricolor]XP_057546651.1 uncharacterized protein LOC130825436 isoform X2 [Amaranthus tricolor]XP_057546652.1 uncharacterized protein LOC130825436 isoform X2 [Amaranthus tricolor]
MSDNERSYDEVWDSMWENEASDDEAGKTLSDNGSPGDEPLSKKRKLASDLNEVTIDEHLEAIEEAALKELILNTCGNFLVGCKELPGQLYDSLIEGLTTLVYQLYDKEDLYRMGSSRMVIDQQNKFWEELAPIGEKNESVFEFCKWIFYKKIDPERYSLLTEHDLGKMVSHYSSLSYKKPYTYYRVKENMKSTIDDDILKAIRKVKLCLRLSVDQYTDLLIEMFTDRDMKCQEFLIAKAVEIIDIETLYSLDAHSLSFIIEWPDSKRSPHEEFDSLLKFHLFNITLWRKRMVKENVDDATFPFVYLLVHWNNIMPLRGHFDDFIEVAELRRKAEGTRFINRDHFMWAFRERGYELPSMFMDIAASRNADDKADQPPYHIYFTAIALSNAGQEPLQFEHLAFAVVFSNSFGFSNEEEVKKMKVDFQAFKTALSNHGVSVPKYRSAFKTKSYFYDVWQKQLGGSKVNLRKACSTS